MDEYARLEVLDPSKLPGLGAQIWNAIQAANLHEDLGIDADHEPDDAGTLVEHLDGYLCEVKDVQIKDGLHVLGVVPEGPHLRGLVAAIGRHGSGAVPGLRRAVGAAFGLDEEALVAAPGAKVDGGPQRRPDRALPRHRLPRQRPARPAGGGPARAARTRWPSTTGTRTAAKSCALRCSVVTTPGWPAPCASRPARSSRRLRRTTDEIDNVLGALRGRHVPAGPSGSPTRGRFDVLPTGRNFYSVDPRALPSELSYADRASSSPTRCSSATSRDTGALPEMVGLVAWGTAAMRTQGDDAAEVLALLGVRPTWHPASRRVTGLEVIPLEELGRPRIDVTLRISGFFRDAFPHLHRAARRRGDDGRRPRRARRENFVAKHARAEAATAGRRARRGRGVAARDDADLRLQARDLRRGAHPAAGDARLARRHGPRRGLRGVGRLRLRSRAGRRRRRARRCAACFAQIDVAVKNVDSREHDHLDSDDYYQYHGGMIATIRALSGREPAAYLGDSADPEKVRVRTLAEETRRIFRARVANPRWIGSMVRHGFKGAAELAATVDYLFGYDATTDVASDWMYEQVAEKYLLDEDIAAFMDQANPWAARGIAEKLLEAAERGLWAEPEARTLDAIKARYLALEDDLEGATVA